MATEKLLQPIALNGLEFKNRIVHAPTTLNMSDPHGYATRRLTAAYGSLAKGGFSAVCVGATCVQRDGLINERMLGMYDEDYVLEYRDTVTEIRNNGALAGIQLFYGGLIPGLGSTIPLEGSKGWIPGTVSQGASNKYIIGNPNSEVMTTEQFEEVVESFGQAARRSREAGFDYLSLHFCHGSLPHTNLSLLSNQGRTDKYADHFLLCEEIIKRTQELCGKDFSIIPRMCCDENLEGGFDIAYFAEHFAPRLKALGITALDATFGSMLGAPSRRQDINSNEFIGPWFFTPKVVNLENIQTLRREMQKHDAELPLMGSANLITPDHCREMVEEGGADFAAVCRLSLDDPDFPNKIVEGREHEVRKSTHTGASLLQGNIFTKGWAGSAQNPVFGREDEYRIVPTRYPKNIAVIGGGSGGLEYAITAHQIGHEVTVYEASDTLGGTMDWAANLPNIPNIEMLRYQADYQRVMMDKYDIPRELNRTISLEDIEALDPDVTVVATGSSPIIPEVEGLAAAQKKGVALTLDRAMARNNAAVFGKRVVIWGAGEALELAANLALGGHEVQILDPNPEIQPPRYLGSRVTWHIAKLEELGITVEPNFDLTKISEGVFEFSSKEGVVQSVEADTLVFCCGRKRNNDLVGALRDAKRAVQVLGDAKELRGYANAIHEAAYLSRTV